MIQSWRELQDQSLQPKKQGAPLLDLGHHPGCRLGAPGWGVGQARHGLTSLVLLPLQGSAPILVAMVILLNIGVAILFINFFI